MRIDDYRIAFEMVATAHLVTLMREAERNPSRDLDIAGGPIDRLYAWRERLIQRVVEGDLA